MRELARFLDNPTDDFCARNLNKGQFIYLKEIEGRRMVVKVFLHKTFHHRLAAWIHQSNADRYERACLILGRLGVSVPEPLLILKSGCFFPERTLFAMGRVEGRMLLELLPEIAADPERIAVLAPRIAGLILVLRQAGLIHRDLNTKNILVTPENQVSLIDFDFTRRPLGGKVAFLKKHRRDIQTFASTCGPATGLATAVLALVDSHSSHSS